MSKLMPNRHGYRLLSIFPSSGIPRGYQPAILVGTVGLGEPDKVGGRQMAKSFSAMGIQSRGSALLHGDATRPKSETAAMA